jgi:hypothetical protein
MAIPLEQTITPQPGSGTSLGPVLAHALSGGVGPRPPAPVGRPPAVPVTPMGPQPTRSLLGATPVARNPLFAPVTGPVKLMRQDQGQDYAGQAGGHVLALGDARIDAIKPNPGGFGTAIYYTLTSGPQKGQQFYVGHASPMVQVGQTVKRGDPVAQLVSPSLGGATTPYWTEVGFAQGGVPEYGMDQGGVKFDAFLRNLQGVPTTGTPAATGTTVDLSGMNDVPKPLQAAIVAAAAKYGVPPQALAGIWREESGRTFPNPAVNSSGYGGLFGTTNGKGTTQDQANMAASVLAAGLQKSGGNMAEALSYYNSGNLTGGYKSVPGYDPSTYTAPTTTTNAGTDAGTTYKTQVGDQTYTPSPTDTSSWGLNTNFDTGSGTQPQGWWNPGVTVPPGLQYIDPSVSQDVLNALNYNDPNLPKAQSALIQAINALRNPSAGLLASGQAASAMLTPAVRQALAAGQLQANTLTQFSRGQQALLGQIPGQVGSIYNQGVNTEAQLAAGTQAALQGADPTVAQSAALQRMGAPAAQIAQLQAQNQAAYQGGGAVLRGLGNLGAMTLNQQGTAAKAYAAQIPALANIQATQQLASLQSATSASIGKILSQQPGLAAKLFTAMTNTKNARVKALNTYITNSENQTAKGKQLALDYWKEGHTVAYQNGQLYINGEKVDISRFKAGTDAWKAANQAKVDTNNAIATAWRLSDAANRTSLMANRDSAQVTYNADRLTQAQQKMQGFSLIPDPNNKGSYIVQPNAGYGAQVNPDGSIVTWKLASGTAAGPGTGKTGKGSNILPAWGLTGASLKGVLKDVTGKIAAATALPANPRPAVGGGFTFPTGYSKSDLVDPTKEPGVLVTNPDDPTGPQIANTLKQHVTPYGALVNQLIGELPVKSRTSVNTIIKMVQGNPAYSTPGVNGRPYETYAQYLTTAKKAIAADIKTGVNPSAAQLASTMFASGYYPDHKMLMRAANAAFAYGAKVYYQGATPKHPSGTAAAIRKGQKLAAPTLKAAGG